MFPDGSHPVKKFTSNISINKNVKFSLKKNINKKR